MKMFTNRLKALIPIFLFGFISTGVQGQLDKSECSGLAKGVFHFYPKNSASYLRMTMDEKSCHILDLPGGDSTDWELKSEGKCSYSLKYVKGKLTKTEREFFTEHFVRYEIKSNGVDYFTVDSYMDKSEVLLTVSDTMWFQPKTVIPDTRVLETIANSAAIKKNHFRDTSQYAIVYLYRPKKFIGFAAVYPIYIDNMLVGTLNNRSAYIFKVKKEGRYEIRSQIGKSKAIIRLDVRFGQKYWVRSTVYPSLKNIWDPTLNLKEVEQEKGEEDFAEVEYGG